jgi:hypothetical protein
MTNYGHSYHSAPLLPRTTPVPPTVSTHSLTRRGETITFGVLVDGRVRVGNKIRARQYARDQYSVLLSRGWTKVA